MSAGQFAAAAGAHYSASCRAMRRVRWRGRTGDTVQYADMILESA